MALLFDSWLVELLAVLLTLLAGFYAYCTVQFQHWTKHGIPQLTPSFPCGNITDLVLLRKPVGEVNEELYKRSKHLRLVGIYQFCTPTLMINDPDLIKAVLVKDFAHFHDHGSYVDEKADPLSAHLFSMEGSKWKHMRNKLSPTFTSGKIKAMFPAVVESGRKVQEYLAPFASREHHRENIKSLALKYSTDVIATCAFGVESNVFQNSESEFVKMGHKMGEQSLAKIVRDILTFIIPSIGTILKMQTMQRDVADFFRGVVRDTISYRETNNVSRPDFMQLLMKMREKNTAANSGASADAECADMNTTASADESQEKNYYDVNGMTYDEITAQALVFFLGGMDTSATVISFCLYEISVNQQLQERLFQEIQETEMTYEGLMGMTYLDKIVSEAMRRYPPAPFLARICVKDYTVPESELTIQKGTRLTIPVSALHHDEQYFPNPEQFDPERFSEEAKSRRPQFAYLPFGEGPRICIASRFALMQVKIGLVSIVSQYHLNVCDDTPIPLKISPKTMVTSAQGGIFLKITARR